MYAQTGINSPISTSLESNVFRRRIDIVGYPIPGEAFDAEVHVEWEIRGEPRSIKLTRTIGNIN